MKVLNYEICDFFEEVYRPSEVDMFSDFFDWEYDWDNFNVNSHIYKTHFFDYVSREYIRNIKSSKGKKFFIIGKPEDAEILYYVDDSDFFHSYFINMKKIVKLFPINALIVEDKTYNEFINDNNEEIEEILNTEIQICNKKNSNKSFKNLKSFISTYELGFLNQEIFSNIKNKFMFS